MRLTARTWRSAWPLLVIGVIAASFASVSRRPDQQLRRRILAQLEANPATAHLPIDIAAASGVATVSGEIVDRTQQARVLATVARTDGVLDVIDDLAISDRVIIQKVLDGFHQDSGLAAIPVTVTSIDGEVTLRSDQTNAAQRRQMVQLAASVDGVNHVIDAMK